MIGGDVMRVPSCAFILRDGGPHASRSLSPGRRLLSKSAVSPAYNHATSGEKIYLSSERKKNLKNVGLAAFGGSMVDRRPVIAVSIRLHEFRTMANIVHRDSIYRPTDRLLYKYWALRMRDISATAK